MEQWMVFALTGAIMVGGIALYTLLGIYFERKISAFIQDRLGPMETGKFGTLQTLADIVKVLQKEIIVPTGADRLYFAIAPILIFVSIFMGFSAIPFTANSPTLNVGVFFILAIVSLEVPGILMAGWGSNNKYALMGAVRSVAQIVSYEIPAGLAVLSMVMLCQSMDLGEITQLQGTQSPEPIFFIFTLSFLPILGSALVTVSTGARLVCVGFARCKLGLSAPCSALLNSTFSRCLCLASLTWLTS